MAQCRMSCHEFIQSVFPPMVAIIASEDAENACLKNNLRFVDMMQPFSTLDGDAQIRDPSGMVKVLKNFRVNYENMTQQPPQPQLSKKILSEAVHNASSEKFVPQKFSTSKGDLSLSIEVPSSTPWFEIWRQTFLQIQHLATHELLRHYVACIIVVSSSSENPMEQLQKLSQYQHQHQHQNSNNFSQWFSPNILKYYLLIHDSQQTELSRGEEVFEQMKNMYGGSNCHYLPINSCPADKPRTNTVDPWASLLKQRALIDGSLLASSNASSGTVTPRDDLTTFPCRVSEGDSSEASDQSISHPLSSSSTVVEDKVFEEPSDMPYILNRAQVTAQQLTQSHGSFLSEEDVKRIQLFHNDFCIKGLFPHIERQIKHLSDIVASRPRSKSLLSATRRWLGSSKPTATTTNSVIYSREAAELQTRRLGDLCFLFRLYEMASNAYVTAKNDFKSDQAWLYFAGAQEMAGLAAFMNVGDDYPSRYLKGSLDTYLNVCKVYNPAMRLTLVTTEILKMKKDYTEAAMMFIKMTSEESDLVSGLMLEQAAHCFINARTPFPRKYAFHMTLAGHRFSKAGQKAHALRAYKQALQVYFDRNWILVEDHIFYSIGKQALGLKKWAECLQANMYLMKQVFKTVSTYQSPTQQLAYVKEFLEIFHNYSSTNANNMVSLLSGRELHSLGAKSPHVVPGGPRMTLFPLPIPAFHPNSTKILLGDALSSDDLHEGWVNASGTSFSDEDSRESRWIALEQDIVSSVQGPQMIFKPKLTRLSDTTPNTSSPEVPVRELVNIEIKVENPLLVGLTVSRLEPIYDYFDEDDLPVKEGLRFDPIADFFLPPQSSDYIRLRIFPELIGRFTVNGVSFTLSLSDDTNAKTVNGQNLFTITGRRLYGKEDLKKKNYSKDQRLNILVVPPAAKLCISIKEPPPIMCCGELFAMNVVFCNDGTIPLKNLYITTPNPKIISLGSALDSSLASFSKPWSHVPYPRKDASKASERFMKIEIPGGKLDPGKSIEDCLWLHAPLDHGAFDLELLFYYETENYPKPKYYRTIRHFSSVFLEHSVSLRLRSLPNISAVTDSSDETTHSTNLVATVKVYDESEGTPETVSLLGITLNSPQWILQKQELPKTILIKDKQTNRMCIPCHHLRSTNSEELLLSYLLCNPNQHLLPCWAQFTVNERLSTLDILAETPMNPGADYVPPPPSLEEVEHSHLKEVSILNMVFTVMWKAFRGDREIWGQQSVSLQDFGDVVSTPFSPLEIAPTSEEIKPLRIIPEEKSPSGRSPMSLTEKEKTHLVTTSIRTAPHINHDFRNNVLCQIHYELSLHNCSAASLNGTMDFTTRSSHSSYAYNAKILPVRCSTKRLVLGPYESKTLKLASLVTTPGTYSIGLVTVKMATVESKEEWIHQSDEYAPTTVVTQTSTPFTDS